MPKPLRRACFGRGLPGGFGGFRGRLPTPSKVPRRARSRKETAGIS
jgi:hypothetical protein